MTRWIAGLSRLFADARYSRKVASTSDPTVTSDTAAGFRVGDVWVNTATGNIWTCYDATAGAAKWRHNQRILAQSAVAVTAPPNDTNENILATITIPAGAMGANGSLQINKLYTHTSSGNNKTLRARLGGIGGTAFCAVVNTNSAAWKDERTISNVNAENSQKSMIASGAGANTLGGSPTTGAIDTSAATTLVLTAQKATGSETVILEYYRVELMRPDIT